MRDPTGVVLIPFKLFEAPHLEPMTRQLVPGTWYQVRGTWCQVPSTRNLVPGTWYLPEALAIVFSDLEESD